MGRSEHQGRKYFTLRPGLWNYQILLLVRGQVNGNLRPFENGSYYVMSLSLCPGHIMLCPSASVRKHVVSGYIRLHLIKLKLDI